MRRETFILIFVVLIVAPLLSNCSESPVAPDGPLRDGMPDWNEHRYDFIAQIDERCQSYYSLRWWWDPKFKLYLWGVSPDDRELVFPYRDGLGGLDYATKTFRSLTSMQIGRVERSRDGRYLFATRYNVRLWRSYVVYDFRENRWMNIALSDSVLSAGDEARWLPGDSSVIIRASLVPGVWTTCELSVREPFAVRRYPGEFFDAHANGKWYKMVTPLPSDPDKTVRLLVGTLGDSAAREKHVFDQLTGTSVGRISPDGRWLSANVRISLHGTRFKDHGTISGLAIIDLRSGSPTQYKIIRVFPDHTHLERNCGGPFPDVPGIWAGDSHHIYYERVRESDSTMQFARLDFITGDEEIVSDFK